MKFFTLLLLVAAICASNAAENKKDTKLVEKTKDNSKSANADKSYADNRDKRTLYDFGNAGYLYADVAARRSGFEGDANAYYTTQNGHFNGKDAIAQFSNQFGGHYAGYPQYLEAPEPIIEIIIKDSNETLPTETPQKIITKKKKEKVHVFYVNYKKDKNNKLHLETPIASLNNDDNEADEEEIIDYPPVTAAPPLKTTTLRTIIHPDSEKYHSNSGIHVTFGTADKSQTGHILEEHNAESLQHEVVALPSGKLSNYSPTTRADFGHVGGTRPADNGFTGQVQQPRNNFYQAQQLPAQHANAYFRAPVNQQQQLKASQVQNVQHNYQQQSFAQPQPQQHQHYQHQQFQQQHQTQPQQQQQQYQPQKQYHQAATQSTKQHASQQQQQQQRQNYNQSPSTTSQTLQGKFPFLQELQQQAKYFVQHNQHYNQQQHKQQQTHNQQQQYQQKQQQQQQQQLSKEHQSTVNIGFGKKPEQAVRQSIVFPTHSNKQQELPTNQTPLPYQPIKFRPTPAPLAAHFKPNPFNNYQNQQQAQQQQQQHPQKQALQFNRQPEFIQKPTFVVTSPPTKSEYFKFSTPAQHNSATSQATQNQQYQGHSQNVHAQQEFDKLNNYFGAEATRGTSELLKSIPKYEQHITETIHNTNNNYQPFSSNVNNQVIHDIPAPNLGTASASTAQPAVQVKYNSGPTVNTEIGGHYITSSSRQPTFHVTSTTTPQYAQTQDGQKIMIVTPMPVTTYSQYVQQPRQSSSQITAANSKKSAGSSPYSVSNYHADVFKQLEQQQTVKTTARIESASSNAKQEQHSQTTASTGSNSNKSAQTLLQLPEEVPDDLREQLLSSGILNNADISVLDYDKVGGINLENLPAEHLKNFYGAGGGAQISESNRVLSVVKPNGENVTLSAKEIERVKFSHSLPQKQNLDVKVVHFDKHNEAEITNEYVKPHASLAPTVHVTEQRQYNRYLPLKINGAQFPLPESKELEGKKIVSVVVLAPVDGKQTESAETRSARDAAVDTREIKFLGGDLIKSLVKKPTTENFKRWLEKESRTDVEFQSIVLLVAKPSENAEQEIFMYDISTGIVNKLNGELSSAFVRVAEENVSVEDLEHASTLDQSALQNMMHKSR